MIKPFSNWQLKLMAVFSAIVLWFFVVGLDNTIFIFPEPIQIKVTNLNQNISLGNTLPESKIYLKTDSNIFKNLNKNDFDLSIDLKDLGIGEHLVQVLAVSKNNQVTIIKVEPREVTIRLSQISEKEVPIIYNIIGNPKQGYDIKNLDSQTKTATVKGSQNLLNIINNVKAELVMDGTQTENINQNVSLKLPDILNVNSEIIKITPDQINLSATVIPIVKQKSVKINLKLLNVIQDQNWVKKIMLSSETINIEGPEDKLKNINALDTKPFNPLDLIGSPGETLQFNLPEGVTVAPNTKITATLKFNADEETTVSAPVIFTKQNPKFNIKKALPDHLSVRLVGSKLAIKNLQAGDITVNINLEKVPNPGTFTINPTEIIVPSGLELLDYSPLQIKLET